MVRKDFLKNLGILSASFSLTPILFLESCQYKPVIRKRLSVKDIPLLDEIGETILPETKRLPGAKATEIGAFILLMYNDCMPPEEQKILLDGINLLDDNCATKFGESFTNLQSGKKIEIIKGIQEEAISFSKAQMGKPTVVAHWFDLVLGLTINGYFTSEIGMTVAREYNPIPGKYIGCITYEETQKVNAL